MKNEKKAYLYLFLTILFWSTVAAAFKLALKELDFISLLGYSSLTSVAVLFVALMIRGQGRRFFAQTTGELVGSAFLGLLNPFLYYFVLFKAYDLLPAQQAQPLNYTWAVVLALLSVPMLKAKLKATTFIALLISFLGVVVISTRGNLLSFKITNGLGIILALGSSVIWAVYWLLNVRDSRDPVVKLFTNFLFGSFYIVLFLIISGKLVLPSPTGLLAAGYIGLFEMGVTFIFWLKALELSPHPERMGNYIYFSPFLSLVFIRLVVGEQIHLSSILGLTLIIIGVLLQRR